MLIIEIKSLKLCSERPYVKFKRDSTIHGKPSPILRHEFLSSGIPEEKFQGCTMHFHMVIDGEGNNYVLRKGYDSRDHYIRWNFNTTSYYV